MAVRWNGVPVPPYANPETSELANVGCQIPIRVISN